MSATDGSAPVHAPVMLEEALQALAGDRPLAGLEIVDATLGLGGHAEALLQAGARVLGLDRDAESLAVARARLHRFEAEGRFRARHADHRSLVDVLVAEGATPVDGVIADLGISSFQLESAERGFAFSADGPLDMRMDRSAGGPTAADLVASLDERELARLLATWGEEPAARRIARAIVRARAVAPIRSTAALAAVIAAARTRPGRPGAARLHPATLTFQALRIAVNREVDGLAGWVGDAVAALRPRGRLVVIAFHSLEDRAVKTALRALEKGCTCPPRLVVCACGKRPQVRLVPRRAIRPGEEEIARNPRARSARMRVAEKIGEDLHPRLRLAA